MQISELIKLLLPMELEAAVVYEKLARQTTTQPDLSEFLQTLFYQEVEHAQLLEMAEQLLKTRENDVVSSLLTDPSALQQSQQHLTDLLALINDGIISEQALLGGIVQAEFSEWNSLFLYVVAHFRQHSPVFQRVAAVIEQHKRHIEGYIASRPESIRPPNRRQTLPRVWAEQVLVVDDNEALRFALVEALSDQATVVAVGNGQQALQQVQKNFFDVVISDVDMPVMDGITFYNTLREDAAGQRQRFIFITGRSNLQLNTLCERHHIPLLLKPFRLETIRKTAAGIISRHA